MTTYYIIKHGIKKKNAQQPQDQDQRVEEERRENGINRSGSKEPDRFRTHIKGPRGPVCSFATNPSLSKLNLEREALPSLLKQKRRNEEQGAAGGDESSSSPVR